jgi:hypothetical protein
MEDFCTISPSSDIIINTMFEFPNLVEISGKTSASSSIDAIFGISEGSKFKSLTFGPLLQNIYQYSVGTV